MAEIDQYLRKGKHDWSKKALQREDVCVRECVSFDITEYVECLIMWTPFLALDQYCKDVVKGSHLERGYSSQIFAMYR